MKSKAISTLKIVDSTLNFQTGGPINEEGKQQTAMHVTIFANKIEYQPKIWRLGDIIRIHRASL